MRTVHVAAGIICKEDSDEVLAVQRGYGEMAGLWEFPGGKIERGETAREACVRELLEELEVHVTDLRDFYTVEYDYEDFHLSMECFLCRIEAGEPTYTEQRNIRWMHRRSLATLNWMPADTGLVEALVQASDDEGVERQIKRRRHTRKSMQGNKRADTKPEMIVRRHLREAGLTGYRLQWRKAPGRPDIAFPGRRIAIFVNGCFWHRCPHCNPKVPKRNTEFWEAKFRRNVERDARAVSELEDAGWTVITIWECELKRDRVDGTMGKVVETVRSIPHPRAHRPLTSGDGAMPEAGNAAPTGDE
ncbi:MAG: DNA mismatch endonuclease Vsr [Collinsella sp.]|nr:DNA mismatch endonuclease Vsr [Collinsella sp.]